MFSRFRSVLANAVSGNSAPPHPTEQQHIPTRIADLQDKHVYSRPGFLDLSEDEVLISADHIARPILVPRHVSKLPWNAGYAETINSGKSRLNEDQASVKVFRVQAMEDPVSLAGGTGANLLSDRIDGPGTRRRDSAPQNEISNEAFINEVFTDETLINEVSSNESISVTYFGIFDGHAGAGAALMAVNTLHAHIQERLSSVLTLILADQQIADIPEQEIASLGRNTRKVDTDGLVIGALELAFCAMDDQIGRERTKFNIRGGCTALVAVFVLGRVYLANAGDCRAVLSHASDVHPMSDDFTPESERHRLQLLARLQPELLHNEFTHLEFQRRLYKKDVGKMMLYRDAQMSGWAYKQVTDDDTKFPLVSGEGKRTRMLATIGVTRGFGDHDLNVYDSTVQVKPFLSPMPEVRVFDLMMSEISADDVLIMGCDGLWDVIQNEAAARIVQNALKQRGPDDAYRYVFAAQELVLHARGQLKCNCWRMTDDTGADGPSSADDITAFVIPLINHAQEMMLQTEEELSVLPLQQRPADNQS